MKYILLKSGILGVLIFVAVPWLCPLVASAEAPALKCLDKGKIRYRKFGKMIDESVAYCFDKDKGVLEAGICSKGSCDALKAINKKDDTAITKSISSSYGTPGFHACRTVGGEPQLMEYFDGATWIPTDRCIFPSDRSFINTARLLQKNMP